MDRYGTEASEVVQLGKELGLLTPLGTGASPLEVEVVWSVRRESALSVDDFLARRTRLAQELPDRGASLAGRVAQLMGPELGWSSSDQAAFVRAFLQGAHREYDVGR